MNITGPLVPAIRQAEEEGNLPQIVGVLERCDGCRTTRRPGVDPLWPVVPILRQQRLILTGFCPRCAGKLAAYMLFIRQPWVQYGASMHLALGMMG